MIWAKKIKAGALQFVLFIGAVVAILLMAFVLLSHTHKHFDRQTDFVISTIKSAGFGIDASLARQMPLGNAISIKDQSELPIDIVVKRELWGVFEKRTALASHGKTKQLKMALVGGRAKNEMPSLYIADKQRPLILAGNSRITGTAYLPEQGLKMGNIYGNSYNGSQLLYGIQKKSDATLPRLGTELSNQIESLTDVQFTPEGKVLPFIPVREFDNSFAAETLIIYERSVRLRNLKLTGNIVVSASDKIVVEPDTQLQDVILMAPKIVIKDWVKGNFQAIASESISVGKKCVLAYPTALVVNKKEEDNSGSEDGANQFVPIVPSIYIDSYAWVGGVVLVNEKTTEQQYSPQIKIEENAKIVGEVYCTKNLELKGRVNGSVITDSFIAMENGSVYQNHLYNGQINNQTIDTSYSGLLLADPEQSKKVMKWLY